MDVESTEFRLDLRHGLPDSLRILLEEYPRSGWQDDPGYGGLIQFWLDRHMMFRRLTEKIGEDTLQALDGQLELSTFRQSLAHLGSIFVQELHGHHNIEDHHYFPVLARLDPRIQAGFDLLDKDHHALDPLLGEFTYCANAVLRSSTSTDMQPLDRLQAQVSKMSSLLDRHLVDEEELVVPVILKHGANGLA